jgi:hypothetical protein
MSDFDAPPQVLRNAADYLADNGWVQGFMYRGVGVSDRPAACAIGAICIVATGRPVVAFSTPMVKTTVRALARHLAREHQFPYNRGDGFDRVTYWNDGYGRTVDDVTATLQAAADAFDGGVAHE